MDASASTVADVATPEPDASADENYHSNTIALIISIMRIQDASRDALRLTLQGDVEKAGAYTERVIRVSEVIDYNLDKHTGSLKHALQKVVDMIYDQVDIRMTAVMRHSSKPWVKLHHRTRQEVRDA